MKARFGFLLQAVLVTSGSAFAVRNSPPGSRGVVLSSTRRGGFLSPKQQKDLLRVRVEPRLSKTKLAEHDADTEPASSGPSSRTILASIALSLWSLTASAAHFGILPGLPQPDGSFAPYTNALLLQDMGSTILTATLGYLLVKAITCLATPADDGSSDAAYLQPRDARKIIHTVSAPAYILFWPIFSGCAGARVFAATVPLINAARLYLAANTASESDLANAVSRSGDRKEAQGGPFIYVWIMAFAILLFWRESPTAIVALSTMAAGDGLADLLGRRFGKNNPWPVSLTGPENRKSVAGSLALVVGSVLTSAGLLVWLQTAGCLVLTMSMAELIGRLVVITGVAAFVELIPFADDNYTVPATAALLSLLLLG